MKSEIVFIKIIGYMFYSQYNYHISHHNYQFSFLSITLHVVEKPLLQQLRNLNLFVSRSTFALTEPRRALQPKGTQRFPWIGLFVVQAIIIVKFKMFDFLKVPYFCWINSGPIFYMSAHFFGPDHYKKPVFMFLRNYKEILSLVSSKYFLIPNPILTGEQQPIKRFAKIHLINQYETKSYLDTCGDSTCNGLYAVHTSRSVNRAPGSGTWEIRSANESNIGGSIRYYGITGYGVSSPGIQN